MTLTNEIKRQIGQHFVFGFHGTEISKDIEVLIKEYHVGNVILMKRNVESAKQTRQLVADLQKLAKDSGHEQPLLIGIDQENGLVSAFSSPTAGTQFPGAMALATSEDVSLAETVTKASAQELKMVGINWVYSPVADVNTDRRNPVIGVRSFGEDADTVAKFAQAVAKAHADNGVAPTAKHFPGHGDTHVDSHLALPVINKSKEDISKEELVPFRGLIGEDIACIMTGHMALPKITGSDTPCSLSRVISTELLRDELKFAGVIVTDCLEMDAIADEGQGGCGVAEGALRALEAGADIAMICHTFERQKEAVEKVWAAVASGRLELDGSRISTMKSRFTGSWEDALKGPSEDWEAKWQVLREKHEQVSKDAYRKTLKIVRGEFPVKAEKVVLYTPIREGMNRAVDGNTARSSYEVLREALGCEHVVYGKEEAVRVVEADLVVFVLENADQRRWQLARLGEVRCGGQRVVVVSSCNGYEVEEISDWAVLCSEYTTPALLSFVAVCVCKQ